MAEGTPHIDDSIILYVRIWDVFGEQPVDYEALVACFSDRDSGAGIGEPELERRLNVLVTHGLVDREDGQYRVQCTSYEDVSAWAERGGVPEAIYRQVRQAATQIERTSEADAPAVFERENEAFLSLPAEEETNFSALVTEVADRLGRSPAFDGIVIRCPAAVLGVVQQVADELCDADAMAATELPYRFEKVISNIRGENKDDLEYRLYLRAIR